MAVCFSVENNGWDKSGGAGQVTVELGQEALVGLVVAHDGWLWCGGEWLGQGRKNESEAFWGSGEMGLSFETINKIGLLGCWSELEERLADNGGVFVVKMGMEAKERSGGDSTMVERRSSW
uniref:Uncharacterized protein n=1 Tax=Populus trichocarpa TaxID=3694 RepID=B9H3E6_POPTR